MDPMGTCTCSEQLLSKAPLWFKIKKLFLLESVFVKVADTWQEGDVINFDDGDGVLFLSINGVFFFVPWVLWCKYMDHS